MSIFSRVRNTRCVEAMSVVRSEVMYPLDSARVASANSVAIIRSTSPGTGFREKTGRGAPAGDASGNSSM